MRTLGLMTFALAMHAGCDDPAAEIEPTPDALSSSDMSAGDAVPGDSAMDAAVMDSTMDMAPDQFDAGQPAPDSAMADAGNMDSQVVVTPDAVPMPLTPEEDCQQQPHPVAPVLRETQINDKRMLYSDRPAQNGVLFIFHGNGGSPSIWIEQTEHIIITLAALERGLLVIALKSTDAGWNKSCCQGEDACCEGAVCCPDENGDIDNTHAALAHVIEAGLATHETPLFALGYSNGGGFTGRLTQGMNLVAAATVNSGSSGRIIMNTDDVPPMYFQGASADPIVRSEVPSRVHASFVERGVRTALRINEPAALTPGRLSRIDGVSCEHSITLFEGLRSAALIDDDGMLTGTVDATMEALEANRYWREEGLEPHARNVTLQLRELAAQHPLSSEWVTDIMDFLLAEE